MHQEFQPIGGVRPRPGEMKIHYNFYRTKVYNMPLSLEKTGAKQHSVINNNTTVPRKTKVIFGADAEKRAVANM